MDLEAERAQPMPTRPRTRNEKVRDPGFQTDLKRSVVSLVDARYAALFSSLRLDPKQLQRLREILSERTQGAGENLPVLFPARPELVPGDPEAFQAAIDLQVRTVLNAENYSQYQAYQATLPARNLVDRLQRALGAAAVPMTTIQAATIIEIASEASSSGSQPSMQSIATRASAAIGASVAPLSDKMMERAAAMLTKDQYEALDDFREQRDAELNMDAVIARTERAPDLDGPSPFSGPTSSP
jgi:hypothetical protein